MAEYQELKDYWQVNPYLHQLLQAELDAVLEAKGAIQDNKLSGDWRLEIR